MDPPKLHRAKELLAAIRQLLDSAAGEPPNSDTMSRLYSSVAELEELVKTWDVSGPQESESENEILRVLAATTIQEVTKKFLDWLL